MGNKHAPALRGKNKILRREAGSAFHISDMNKYGETKTTLAQLK